MTSQFTFDERLSVPRLGFGAMRLTEYDRKPPAGHADALTVARRAAELASSHPHPRISSRPGKATMATLVAFNATMVAMVALWGTYSARAKERVSPSTPRSQRSWAAAAMSARPSSIVAKTLPGTQPASPLISRLLRP
jgi:hypothetical protein